MFKRILLSTVFCLSLAQAQAQMVGPLSIMHGSDYPAANAGDFFAPEHMSFANGVLTIQGELEAEDSYMIDYKIAANGWHITTLALNSGGGSSQAGFQLADMVRKHGWSTIAENCQSACVVVWAAGRSKVVQGQLGVHQSYDSLQFDQRADLKATAHMGAVLRSYGAPKSVVAHMMATPPSQMYVVTADDIRNWK